MASGLTLLIISVTAYVGAVLFLGINIIDELLNQIRETQVQMMATIEKFSGLPEDYGKQIEEMISFYEVGIPSIFIIASFSFAFTVVLLNGVVAKRLGHNMPEFTPFRDMKLPAVLVWSFFIILLLPYVANLEQGTTIYLTYVNASIILRFLFLIQGISLVHYYMNEKKLSKLMTIISTIIALLLSQITMLLGVLDSGMNIRAWIGKKK